MSLLFADRFEHPAGGYKKMFETCEELAEPIPATIIGLFALRRKQSAVTYSCFFLRHRK